uniref:Nucleolar GTP-binding protein 2 n=1 Tax=Schistosoma haematobium TaxID=6185 RepID=A0A095AT89_SCHHA
MSLSSNHIIHQVEQRQPVLPLLSLSVNTNSLMSSCEDLFQSFSRKLDISNISSDLFSDSSTKSLGVKLEKRKDRQDRVTHKVGELIPDFSSYEKHELVVESDLSNHTSSFHYQLANCKKERNTPPEYLPNLVVKTKPYDICISSSTAFCSTPGPSNSLSTLKSHKNAHDLPAPKIVSGDALVNTLQVTPIHPVFTNRKSNVNFKMGNSSPQVNCQQTLTPSYHSISTYNKKELKRWKAILSEEYPTLIFHADMTKPLGKVALMGLLRQMASLHSKERPQISVGIIGYPNVGKSSIINALRNKKACLFALKSTFLTNILTITFIYIYTLILCHPNSISHQQFATSCRQNYSQVYNHVGAFNLLNCVSSFVMKEFLQSAFNHSCLLLTYMVLVQNDKMKITS